MRKTKIVCTIGPATEAPDKLDALIKAGMDVARLNFSHGSHDEHARKIAHIRRIAAKFERPIAVLQDLCGPKVRVGNIAGGQVELERGRRFILTCRDVPGSPEEVSIPSCKSLPHDVRPGDPILLGDGAIELTVKRVTDEDIECLVIVGGSLSSHKGVNLPTRSLSSPSITEKDKADLTFGLAHGVDAVALSFVRSAADIESARSAMRAAGRTVPIIAKIEKHEALARIDEIVEAADGIMVARGDLGVEIPIERVPMTQKMLIRKANAHGKPVITATQMLKSMVDSPRPTRAEAADVANAILDGSDAVMLSEETAVGAYPVAAVETMSRIAVEVEADFPFNTWAARYEGGGQMPAREAVAEAACRMAQSVNASAIVVCTQSGSTTRLVSKYRPRQPILTMTPDEGTWRTSALVWGAIPLLMPQSDTADAMEREAIELAVESGVVRAGDTVVITAGLPLHVPGTTNFIRIIRA